MQVHYVETFTEKKSEFIPALTISLSDAKVLIIFRNTIIHGPPSDINVLEYFEHIQLNRIRKVISKHNKIVVP